MAASNGFDLRALEALQRRLESAGTAGVREMALATAAGQKIAVEEVAKAGAFIYNLPAARLARDLKATNPRPLQLNVIATGQAISGQTYGGKQTTAGYAVQFLRGRGVQVISRGFVNTTKRGVKLGLRRIGKARTPIEAITGPGAGTALKNRAVIAIAELAIGPRVLNDIAARLSRLLG